MRAAALRAGRDPNAIGLVVVTKYASLVDIRTLLSSGELSDVGENRVQDAKIRKEALGPLAASVRWRMIGHLQTNKTKQALDVFDTVDSVDSLKTAQALDSRLQELGRELEVLIQVNISGKNEQSGVAPEGIEELLNKINGIARLKPRGLMTIAPNLEPPEAVRPYFRKVKILFDRHFGQRPEAVLSMGMSRDFEIAIEEGANLVRIGSSIFSPDNRDSATREDSNDR